MTDDMNQLIRGMTVTNKIQIPVIRDPEQGDDSEDEGETEANKDLEARQQALEEQVEVLNRSLTTVLESLIGETD